VVSLPSADGKITAQQIRDFADKQRNDETAEHNVHGKLVYISNPTELGTTYSLQELEDISRSCKENGMYLYMDGARLGYALSACDCDVTMADIARLCDVFYIGGTKMGAMFGEAVVIRNSAIATDFRYLIKQRGGMLAKGWLLGVQYETLFEDGLYFQAAKHANRLADQLRQTLAKHGFKLYVPGTTNQVFAVLPNSLLQKLSENFTFMVQERLENDLSAVRFCTSWGTSQESMDALCAAIDALA
jgi:threonine aldolase